VGGGGGGGGLFPHPFPPFFLFFYGSSHSFICFSYINVRKNLFCLFFKKVKGSELGKHASLPSSTIKTQGKEVPLGEESKKHTPPYHFFIPIWMIVDLLYSS
jgi:hypothetical protein